MLGSSAPSDPLPASPEVRKDLRQFISSEISKFPGVILWLSRLLSSYISLNLSMRLIYPHLFYNYFMIVL